MERSKPDVTLSGGREVVFDLSKLSYGQYKSLFSPDKADKDSDAIVAKTAGMTLEEFEALPYNDARRLMKAFFTKCREPLVDPL
jgi:hypothetical protein